MGRKLGQTLILALFFLLAGLLLAYSNALAQSDDLRVYVRMQPEKPNARDGWSFEGADVRVKLELYKISENPPVIRENPSGTKDVQPPSKTIDWRASGYKLFYVWDNLDITKTISYDNPFQPLEGGHFLFAYAANNDGVYQTPATKFFIQYNLKKTYVTPVAEQVYVNPDYVRWGESGQPSYQEKAGQITEEATSTMKILTPTATAASTSPSNYFDKAKEIFKTLFSGNFNVWIVLLVVGLVLLIVARVLLGKGKEK